MIDDFSDDPSTTGRIAVGQTTQGLRQFVGDDDWFALSLTKGQTVAINTRLVDDTTPQDARYSPSQLALFDRNGALVERATFSADAPRTIFYTADRTITYYVAVEDFAALPDTYGFELSVTEIFDIPSDTTTTARLDLTGRQTGMLETPGDEDWFAVTLDAGTRYVFDITSNAFSPTLTGLFDAEGQAVAQPLQDAFYTTISPRDTVYGTPAFAVTIEQTGTYYVAAASAFSDLGDYTLGVSLAPEDDNATDASTTARILPGTPFEGLREYEWDSDWIAADLDANAVYEINLAPEGIASGMRLVLRGGENGAEVIPTDWNAPSIQYAPKSDETVYIDVRPGFFVSTLGAYTVTLDQIVAPTADLISGTFEAERIVGTEAADTVYGLGGADTLIGAGGRDLLAGSHGPDVVYGDDVSAVQLDADVANQVYRLYQATLDRAPDPMGHDNWTKRISEGELTLGQAAQGFVASAEFSTRYSNELSNTEFVTLLYENVLDSTPDAQGLARWVGDLEGGATRALVVQGFSESAQNIADTSAAATRFANERVQANWMDDVFRLYQATLDRAPDPQGLQRWTRDLADNNNSLGALPEGVSLLQQVAVGFIGSDEFTTRFSASSNTEFVTLLYNNVLGSAPDDAGLARWVSELEGPFSHYARAAVVLGFSQSPQFTAQTQADLKRWMRDQGVDDQIAAGGGSNSVTGGQYADVFVFTAGEAGTTSVQDFEAWDYLELRGFGYSSVAEVKEHMTQEGGDVVFADQSVTVVLRETALDAIQADSFFDTFQFA